MVDLPQPIKFVPRPHQTKCVSDIWSYLTNATGDPVAVQPTGSGKSLITAMLADEISKASRRMVILAPKRELVEQNYEKICLLNPSADAGVYCAGLKRKDTDNDIIYATVQSVFRRPLDFGFRHMVVVDEAHMIQSGDQGMFHEFFHGLRINNPSMRIVGLTATPYRLDSGLIYGGDDNLFDDVCHATGIPELLDNGYIAPIRAASVKQISMSGIKKVAGDYDKRAMAERFGETLTDAVRETVDVANAERRHHCLVFGVNVDHANSVAAAITEISGEEARVITGDSPLLMRDACIRDFKSGALRWLVSVDTLHTGFDAPSTDLISVMRSTQSPGLFYQLCGRGFRLADGKDDCLLLDFGGNLARHGALDSEDYGKEALKKKNGDEAVEGKCPMKTCGFCKNEIPAMCKRCPECGAVQPESESEMHESEAESYAAALECQATGDRGDQPSQSVRRLAVDGVRYFVHQKRGASKADPRTLRVEYQCYEVDGKGERQGDVGESVSEWICIEHSGWTRMKAEQWWNKRSQQACPIDTDDALYVANKGGLAHPMFIDVERDGKYDRIVSSTGMGPQPLPVKLIQQYSQDELPF